jgi:hypothetical protein
MLRQALLPVCRAEHRSFRREQPAGALHGCSALPEGQGWPFWQPSSKVRSTGDKRQPGRLFFGYFLLATQKKVTRLRVREPDSNNHRASDTLSTKRKPPCPDQKNTYSSVPKTAPKAIPAAPAPAAAAQRS